MDNWPVRLNLTFLWPRLSTPSPLKFFQMISTPLPRELQKVDNNKLNRIICNRQNQVDAKAKIKALGHSFVHSSYPMIRLPWTLWRNRFSDFNRFECRSDWLWRPLQRSRGFLYALCCKETELLNDKLTCCWAGHCNCYPGNLQTHPIELYLFGRKLVNF